jgi:hypothetical protein
VRRANPVVTKIQRLDQQGEVAVYDDKSIVEDKCSARRALYQSGLNRKLSLKNFLTM